MIVRRVSLLINLRKPDMYEQSSCSNAKTEVLNPPKKVNQRTPLSNSANQHRIRDIPPELLAPFNQTNLFVSVTLALAFLSSIAAGGAFLNWVYQWSAVAASLIYPCIALFIARQQRSIELMVHDASHYAWHRRNRTLNDFLATFLVAIPSFQALEDYRRFHIPHHSQYFSANDPCRRRFEEILATFRKDTLLLAFGKYVLGYYREVARQPKTLFRAMAWHMVVVILPLPILRVIAELEEHDYSRQDSESVTTISNLGLIHGLIVHPFADGYHWIHHHFAQVPQWRHRKLHKHLLKHSAAYRGSPMRFSVLGPVYLLRQATLATPKATTNSNFGKDYA
jgi:fatty acid desaturase